MKPMFPVLLALAAVLASPGDAQITGGLPRAGLAGAPSADLWRSGLLDKSRFRLDHSLSFTYGTGGGDSYGAGLWMSRLGYRLADPLRVSVDVGAALNPMGGTLLNEKSFFLGGFHLEYKPSNHFQVNVSYLNLPADPSVVRAYRGYRNYGLPQPWSHFSGPGR